MLDNHLKTNAATPMKLGSVKHYILSITLWGLMRIDIGVVIT